MKLINLRKHPISTSLVSIIEEKMENSFFSAKREYGYFDTKWMTNCDKAVNSYFVRFDGFLCPLPLNAAGGCFFKAGVFSEFDG